MFVTPPTQRLGPQLTAVRHLVNCCSRVYITPLCGSFLTCYFIYIILLHIYSLIISNGVVEKNTRVFLVEYKREQLGLTHPGEIFITLYTASAVPPM